MSEQTYPTPEEMLEVFGDHDPTEHAAEAEDAGLPADSPEAAAAATAHRAHITSRFYEVSEEMHQGLAQLYVADDRFMRSYDDQRPGLAQYVGDAILALYR